MSIPVLRLTGAQVEKILKFEEWHFGDLKSRDIKPGKLTKTLSAFANADGGELYVGIDELDDGTRGWRGFDTQEDANGHIQAFEDLFPLGGEYQYEFLDSEEFPGKVLRVTIQKSSSIKKASDGVIYKRRGPQSSPVKTDEAIKRLERTKGITSFETEPV